MTDQVLRDLSSADLFMLYRRLLVIFCSIYAGIRLMQTIGRWFKFLAFPDRSRRLLRSYLFVHILRVRWRRFGPEYIQIGGLLCILTLIVWLHYIVAAS